MSACEAQTPVQLHNMTAEVSNLSVQRNILWTFKFFYSVYYQELVSMFT